MVHTKLYLTYSKDYILYIGSICEKYIYDIIILEPSISFFYITWSYVYDCNMCD